MGSILPSHFCGQKKARRDFLCPFFSELFLFAVCFFPWMLVFLILPCNFPAFLACFLDSQCFAWILAGFFQVLQTSFPFLPVESSFDRFSSGMLHLNFLPFLRFIFLATSLHFSIIFHGLSSYISSIQSPHDLHSWFLFLCSVFLVRRNTSLQTHNHHSFFRFSLVQNHKMARDSSFHLAIFNIHLSHLYHCFGSGFHESCWGLLTADHDFENRTLESCSAHAPAVKNVPTWERWFPSKKDMIPWWFHWWFHGDFMVT